MVYYTFYKECTVEAENENQAKFLAATKISEANLEPLPKPMGSIIAEFLELKAQIYRWSIYQGKQAAMLAHRNSDLPPFDIDGANEDAFVIGIYIYCNAEGLDGTSIVNRFRNNGTLSKVTD